jgi:hypothetical protein
MFDNEESDPRVAGARAILIREYSNDLWLDPDGDKAAYALAEDMYYESLARGYAVAEQEAIQRLAGDLWASEPTARQTPREGVELVDMRHVTHDVLWGQNPYRGASHAAHREPIPAPAELFPLVETPTAPAPRAERLRLRETTVYFGCSPRDFRAA